MRVSLSRKYCTCVYMSVYMSVCVCVDCGCAAVWPLNWPCLRRVHGTTPWPAPQCRPCPSPRESWSPGTPRTSRCRNCWDQRRTWCAGSRPRPANSNVTDTERHPSSKSIHAGGASLRFVMFKMWINPLTCPAFDYKSRFIIKCLI